MSPWRKPRRSKANGNCAEVASWRKPSRSIGNGDCLEAGSAPGVVGVRDSKDPGGPVLEFSAGGWRVFLAAVKAA